MNLIPSLPSPSWTLARLRRHFDMIPAERIVLDPAPGTATENDVTYMDDHCNRLCELVDGVLLEKTMGYKEALLAGLLIQYINNYLDHHPLGIALSPDGVLRLVPGLVRAPDVSFIAWERIPGGKLPEEPIPDLVPDLAIEVISKSNTKKEMERKLREYFQSGTRLVWFIHPKTQSAVVYTAPDQSRRLRSTQVMDGGDVLPGFALPLSQLFSARQGPRPK
jgi:Uma2 family endonuclease